MNFLTKRLPTILAILLLVALGGGLWWFWQSNKPVVAEGAKPQKVRITNVADNKLTVSWLTKEAVEGSVEWGVVGGKMEQVTGDERGGGEYKTHHVTITGLQPLSQYSLRIVSGGGKFDNGGSPYGVTTGRVVGTTPPAESFYGEVKGAQAGAVVYVALPDAQVASSLVTATGSYSIPISTVRNKAGDGYVKYDPLTTVATVTVEDGVQTGSAMVLLGASTPVPAISMGQQHDYRSVEAVQPEVAEVSATDDGGGELPGVFNVEPLGSGNQAASEVVLLNPEAEGEVVATTQPEFRGLAPTGATLVITVHSVQTYTQTVTSGEDGTWEWTPPGELAGGEHTITIAYVDAAGIERVITRAFTVSTALAQGGDPAFEATPSGSTASPTPTPTATPTATPASTAGASPRAGLPSTESGVPVTGVFELTLLTGAIGLVIMVLGAALLVL